MATLNGKYLSVIAGFLVVYLFGTAWLTVQRKVGAYSGCAAASASFVAYVLCDVPSLRRVLSGPDALVPGAAKRLYVAVHPCCSGGFGANLLAG